MRSYNIIKSREGFTLIELVIVLVLIGILAAVAIPRFANLQDEAFEASTRGITGDVRSAINIFRAEQLAADPAVADNGWPTLAELQTVGTVITNRMPDNPYNDSPTIADGSASGGGVRDIIAGGAGWAYSEVTGAFWANTSTVSENEF